MAQDPVDVSGLNRLCLVCRKEYGPLAETCCLPGAMVAIKREGWIRRRTRCFDLQGYELDDLRLATLLESAIVADERSSQDSGQSSPGPDFWDQFCKFTESPGRDAYIAIHGALISSNRYDPYSVELQAADSLLDQGQLQQARDTIAQTMPNLLLSPQAHLMCAFVAEKSGEHDRAETERFFARACVEGILSTGDGSREHPYLVARVSDEYDTLDYLDKKLTLQAAVRHGGRQLDVMQCEDGAQVCFDITSAFNRLSAGF